MKSSLLSLVLLLGASASFAQARVEERLREKLATMRPDEKIRVIVYMAEQVDLNALERELSAKKANKQQRHYEVVSRLRALAETSQRGIMQELSERVQRGEAEQVEQMWLANMLLGNLSKRAILDLAERSDVAMIYEDGLLELDRPVEETNAPSVPNGSEPGLRRINAHRLWALGYTGAGSLVMNIDTGVFGTHPALVGKWRGSEPGVMWYHAWFDQRPNPSQVPTDYGTSSKHGTHTMGTMVGLQASTNDTIGVAFGAKWIAAPTIDVGFNPHTSFTLRAFQWAADPDSNGIDNGDVPDVICNSYQDPNVASQQCGATAGGYWTVIQALETMGTAVVFSAGNSGPNPQTLTPPKNNPNIFTVGAIDASNNQIASFSSRGPSSCGANIIKPEVVAPGVSVRSANSATGYGASSGTSMACPHVAGAIALLKEVNPSLTAVQIRNILRETATDLGATGPDNTFGYGLIDVWAAYQYIATTMIFRVDGYVIDAQTGDTLRNARVKNLNTNVEVTTTNGKFSFALSDTGTYLFATSLNPNSPTGYVSRIDTLYAPEDSTIYTMTIFLQRKPNPTLSVNAAQGFTFNLTGLDSAQSTLTISNGGPPFSELVYGLELQGGLGGLKNDVLGNKTNTLIGANRFRGNLFAVTQTTKLKEIQSYHFLYRPSTKFRFFVYENNALTGRYAKIFESAEITTSPPFDGFVRSGPMNLTLQAGKFYIIGAAWDSLTTHYQGPGAGNLSFGSFSAGVLLNSLPMPDSLSPVTSSLPYHMILSTTSGRFISIAPMTGDTLRAGQSRNHVVRVNTAGLDETSVYAASIRITSSDTTRPVFTVPVTLNFTTLSAPTPIADGGTNLPKEFALAQNYPNPFNPTTVIAYQLPTTSDVRLELYDVLGRKISTLVSARQSAGYYAYTLNASALATGVYFYRLHAGDFVQTRKMLLVK
ncbi:MAG: S8 family peptidase [Chloroherpetonaceae bacterium]|nr:S8 family peptidase [Chloroherpetonaceae bacterium]